MKKSIKNISIQFLSFVLVLFSITFSTEINAQQDPEKQNVSEQISEEQIIDLPTLSEIIFPSCFVNLFLCPRKGNKLPTVSFETLA